MLSKSLFLRNLQRKQSTRLIQQATYARSSQAACYYGTNNKYQQNSNSSSGYRARFSAYMLAGAAAGITMYHMQTMKYTAEAEENEKKETPATREVEIPFANELEEGHMRTLKIGEGNDQKVLVARYQGKLYSTGNFCSHFGVPLSFGVLFDDKVVCPAHAAGFSVMTGSPDSAPGLDGIPSFPVVERDGKFYVQVPEGKLPKKVTAHMSKRDPENKDKFVIIGGGAAGLNCAETLRQSNFTGEILILSNERTAPYDRTLLSKALPQGDSSKFVLRPADFLKEYDINIKFRRTVEKIDTEAKRIYLKDGAELNYDKLCIATGSTARTLTVQGHDLKGVEVLRTAKDQTAIKELAAKAKSVVVIGSSFIGSEAAASLKTHYKDKLDVHIVSASQVPFERILGKDVGEMVKSMHEQVGIKMHTLAKLDRLVGNEDGQVTKVVLQDGTEIEADLVIQGLGVTPNTEFLKDTGIQLDKNGGVVCDPFLQTSVKDIFAAGDIVSYPNWQTGERMRIEHWNVALDQGTFAAYNMLNKIVPYGEIPFFWTRFYNKSIQYVGNAPSFDEIHVDGDIKSQKFVCFYIKGDRVLAVSGMNAGQKVMTYLEAMRQNVMPRASAIKSGDETFDSIKKKIKGNVGAGKCKRANCCQKKPAF